MTFWITNNKNTVNHTFSGSIYLWHLMTRPCWDIILGKFTKYFVEIYSPWLSGILQANTFLKKKKRNSPTSSKKIKCFKLISNYNFFRMESSQKKPFLKSKLEKETPAWNHCWLVGILWQEKSKRRYHEIKPAVCRVNSYVAMLVTRL